MPKNVQPLVLYFKLGPDNCVYRIDFGQESSEEYCCIEAHGKLNTYYASSLR